VDAVKVAVEDGVEDEAIITLDRPMQQEKVFVPILAPMCLTTVRSLQQIKCELHGKSWHSMLEPTTGNTSVTNCRKNITVILIEHVHNDDVILKHSLIEIMIRNGQMNIQRARKTQETILEAAVQAGLDMEVLMKLSLLQNEIVQGEFSSNVEVPIVLNDSKKTQCSNEWRTYRERNDNLIKHRGQELSSIQGQCTQCWESNPGPR
jgi:hypothetical protein